MNTRLYDSNEHMSNTAILIPTYPFKDEEDFDDKMITSGFVPLPNAGRNFYAKLTSFGDVPLKLSTSYAMGEYKAFLGVTAGGYIEAMKRSGIELDNDPTRKALQVKQVLDFALPEVLSHEMRGLAEIIRVEKREPIFGNSTL